MTIPKAADKQHKQAEIEPDQHGAAIIDEQGNEIPITDKMIKDACQELEENRKASN
jgi:hypothetical protein